MVKIKNKFKKIDVPINLRSMATSTFHFFTAEFASLSLFEVFIFIAIAAAAVFVNTVVVKNEFASNDIMLKQCQASIDQESANNLAALKSQAEQNSFDRIKIGDTTNILLALKDYNYEKSDLPQSLSELKGTYLNGSIIDAQYNKEYYYKRISAQDYALCVYLSTGVWGTNKKLCPTKDDYLAAGSKTTPTIRLDQIDSAAAGQK